MADRQWQPTLGALEVGVVQLFCAVSIGAAGAVTNAPNTFGRGIKSVVRNAAGKYTIALQDNYFGLLAVTVSTVDASGSGPSFQVFSQAVNSSTAPAVVVQGYTGGVATDPNSGATLLVKLTLKNSSVT